MKVAHSCQNIAKILLHLCLMCSKLLWLIDWTTQAFTGYVPMAHFPQVSHCRHMLQVVGLPISVRPGEGPAAKPCKGITPFSTLVNFTFLTQEEALIGQVRSRWYCSCLCWKPNPTQLMWGRGPWLSGSTDRWFVTPDTYITTYIPWVQLHIDCAPSLKFLLNSQPIQ